VAENALTEAKLANGSLRMEVSIVGTGGLCVKEFVEMTGSNKEYIWIQ
jgi:hypothetical protein